jgi:hypothetical protein
VHVRQKSLEHRNSSSHHQPHHELKMDPEAETRNIRLMSEIIRCIAKSLLASAEELDRSLWHYSTPPIERSQSSSDDYNEVLSL